MKLILSAVLLLSGVAFADLAPLKTTEVRLSILTNDQGLTVYTYDKDTAGVSNCYNGCARAWPPVLAPSGDLRAPLSAITRKDGSRQIAYKGQPLYLYAEDSAPGDITGDGVGNVWHVVHP